MEQHPSLWSIVLGIVSVVAIIFGPIIALYIQRKLDREREAKNRKIAIFRTLMAHRATRLSVAFVEALNGIEVEFYSNNTGTRKIIETWRSYCEHLYSTDADDPAKNAAWNTRGEDMLYDLLFEMGEYLGYHFDKVTLRRIKYSPRGWVENEEDATIIRKAAMAVFSGTKPLLMKIDGSVNISEQGLPSQTSVAKAP
jgi:hypothetical protein